MAVNFSIGINDIEANPNNIAGRFKVDLTKWNFKFCVLNIENFDFIIIGDIIIIPKINLKRAAVTTFTSSWANFVQAIIKVAKKTEIIIKKIANLLLFILLNYKTTKSSFCLPNLSFPSFVTR